MSSAQPVSMRSKSRRLAAASAHHTTGEEPASKPRTQWQAHDPVGEQAGEAREADEEVFFRGPTPTSGFARKGDRVSDATRRLHVLLRHRAGLWTCAVDDV